MTTGAEQQPMQAKPEKEHRWLEQLVGEWTMEGEALEPGQPPHKSTGTESVRSLTLWIIGEGHHDMPGVGVGTSFLTLGYDPLRKKFVGSWVGSMMTNLWVYEGTLDASGKVLTLDCEAPGMESPTTTGHFQDIHEIVSPDHRILRSQVLGKDGKWVQFLTANYHRRR
jgi:hypothetical protein